MKIKASTLLLAATFATVSLAGCSSGASTDVTKEQEEAFRNPPKEIPPASLKAMQEARAKSAQMAEEARRKNAEANRGQ